MKRFHVLFVSLFAFVLYQPSTGHVVLASEHAVFAVPGDFPTIQGAVDAAQPGDAIQVAAGIYCEHVLITKSDLRLHASGGGDTIVSGACAVTAGGYGMRVLGTAAAPVSGVEIDGFTVDGFTVGIGLDYATGSRVHHNEVRNAPGTSGHGILLTASSLNEVTQNSAHDNGHLGIGVRNGSHGNVVRGNRLFDNQRAWTVPGGVCSLMIFGVPDSTGNRILENEVIDAIGTGIMIGSGASNQHQSNNLVAQNRVHGHPDEGILIMAGSMNNVVEQNDARGNGTGGEWPDLGDYSGNSTNVWQRNLGTCAPGNAGCE